jgi:excisionase family DNA binding protein
MWERIVLQIMTNIYLDIPMGGLLNVKQVEKLTGLGKSSIYALIKSHRLPAVIIGRSTRIDPGDLIKFIEQSKTTYGSELGGVQ